MTTLYDIYMFSNLSSRRQILTAEGGSRSESAALKRHKHTKWDTISTPFKMSRFHTRVEF